MRETATRLRAFVGRVQMNRHVVHVDADVLGPQRGEHLRAVHTQPIESQAQRIDVPRRLAIGGTTGVSTSGTLARRRV